MGEPRDVQVSAVAALDEPTRRRLYDYVVRQPEPVGRDEAATALELPRATAAFHLDRLAEEGLLSVVHQRRTSRSGPGAGRPAKLYHRSPNPIAVSLPERHYELAGRLLAAAIQEADRTGQSARTVLDERARDLGQQLGRHAREGHETTSDQQALMRTLEAYGFEPRTTDADIVLGNCPFHSLAREYTDLVCGMNLYLLTGLLHGFAATGYAARLDPAPDQCCVRLTPLTTSEARSLDGSL